MKSKASSDRRIDRVRKFWSGNNRFRLMLTLELAVMLPAAALIYVNFHHLKSIERDKVLEAAIHRRLPADARHLREEDQSEGLHDDGRGAGRSSRLRTPTVSRTRRESLTSSCQSIPWLAHVFLFDAEKGFLFRSQPQQMSDPHFREEHERMAKMFGGWFALEGKMLLEEIHKKSRPITWYSERSKQRRRRCLHDDCLLLVAAAPQGPGRAGRGSASTPFT